MNAVQDILGRFARCAMLGLALLGLLPAAADACPVCFGAAESPLLDAARLGVAVMVAVTLAILVAFGTWFLRLRRLASRESDIPDPQQGGSS